MAVLTLALLLFAQQGPNDKALVLFIDGFLPGAITPEVMPNVHRLKEEGAWSLRARCEDTTISGSGWSTFLTGVHRDKHGVPDNAFARPNYSEYPLFFQRLKESRPGTVCAIAQSWRPIEHHLVGPAEPDFGFYAEYDLASDDYFDAFSVDTMCADAGLIWLKEARVDCVVVMFDESDGVGHSEGNSHYDAADPLYRRKLADIDAQIGRLLAAIEARPTHANERWLVAIHADHAGQRGEGHGLNKPSHREAPLILHGPGVARGMIWPPPKSPDLVASILHHFGVKPDPAWGLDGRAVGFTQDGPPLAWFGRNLLVNNDAEAERGFTADSGVDASVYGWEDPGAVTALRREDGSQVFYAPTAAEMHQRLDLLPLLPWIRDGRVAYEHSQEITLREVPGSEGRFLDAVLALEAGAIADDLKLSITPLDRRALPEWRALFDGTTLAGWTPVNVDPDTFTVRDGMIACSGNPVGEMRTERMFENFVVEFEYQHLKTGGNAGFFVWSDALPAVGAPFIRSIEVQVIDGWETENWTSHGDVFAIWGATLKPDRPHPAGWERCLPDQRRANGTGAWNHFRIVAVDGIIQHWVNGQVVSGGSAVSPRKGYLCLESEGSEVLFRNLRILELPSTGASEAETARSSEGFLQVPLQEGVKGWTRQGWKWAGNELAAPLPSVEEFEDFDLFLDLRVTAPTTDAPPRSYPDPARAGLIVPPIDRLGLSADSGWRRIAASYREGQWTSVSLDGETIEFSVPFELSPQRGRIGIITSAPVPCEVANVFARRITP
ncbi:MAG: DUF1080 domain-containing protein [Planctomycetota bacterium]|nr:DUF1080 domain-containing protein [Planctomycetota bacterium]